MGTYKRYKDIPEVSDPMAEDEVSEIRRGSSFAFRNSNIEFFFPTINLPERGLGNY